MSLKSFLTDLLRLDARDTETRERAAREAKGEAIEALRNLFRTYFEFGETDYRLTLPYWAPTDIELFRAWMEKAVKGEIRKTYREIIDAEIERRFSAAISSEGFLDKIIDKINRKQLRAGLPLNGQDPQS